MTLKQLKYFITIAEERRITAAAKKLNIAQPPLSYQMELLENQLGVILFKRGPRGVELTDAGEMLYKRAVQILGMTTAAEHEVRCYGQGVRGVLSLGTISSSGGVVPNRQMQNFIRSHPEVRFEIHEGNTFAVIEMLEKGLIDLGIVRTPFQPDRLNCCYAEAEPMVAAMTGTFAENMKGNSVTLRELSEHPLIFYRRFETLIQEVFSSENLTPVFLCKNDDARTTLLWARNGLGIGIVPKSALLTLGFSGLFSKEIDCSRLQTRLAAVWMKNRRLTPLAQKFVELFKEQPQSGELE